MSKTIQILIDKVIIYWSKIQKTCS